MLLSILKKLVISALQDLMLSVWIFLSFKNQRVNLSQSYNLAALLQNQSKPMHVEKYRNASEFRHTHCMLVTHSAARR